MVFSQALCRITGEWTLAIFFFKSLYITFPLNVCGSCVTSLSQLH
uniref:Uncharacterized protein n=1 Tax=Anguilla anguilla TaxID=7936 RepID=A0A0E9PUK5_ANGAN